MRQDTLGGCLLSFSLSFRFSASNARVEYGSGLLVSFSPLFSFSSHASLHPCTYLVSTHPPIHVDLSNHSPTPFSGTPGAHPRKNDQKRSPRIRTCSPHIHGTHQRRFRSEHSGSLHENRSGAASGAPHENTAANTTGALTRDPAPKSVKVLPVQYQYLHQCRMCCSSMRLDAILSESVQ